MCICQFRALGYPAHRAIHKRFIVQISESILYLILHRTSLSSNQAKSVYFEMNLPSMCMFVAAWLIHVQTWMAVEKVR